MVLASGFESDSMCTGNLFFDSAFLPASTRTHTPKRWLGLCKVALMFALALGGGTQAADKLVLTTGVLAPYTTPDRKGFLDQMIVAVFREAGLEAELQVYSTATARSLLNADAGIDDGEAMRIAGLEKQYPNLIRVPEALISNDFVAYATHVKIATPDWKSLEPYVVSYMIGWKIFENNVRNAKEINQVRDADQLFGLLANGRTDLALYERWQGLQRVRDLGLKAHALEPPLARTDMFIYLHKKHEALVPRVAQALARMKANGSYQRIFDATLTSLVK